MIITSKTIQAALGNNLLGFKVSGKIHPKFQEVLKNTPGATISPRETSTPLKTAINQGIERFVADLNNSEKKLAALTRQLPCEHRQMVELQTMVNELHLKSELVARIGDSAGQTIRRAQQMGS